MKKLKIRTWIISLLLAVTEIAFMLAANVGIYDKGQMIFAIFILLIFGCWAVLGTLTE